MGQLAATAFFVVTVAPHLPALDAPMAEQGAFYATYHEANALANYFFLLSTPFLLVFLGGLFAALRRAEGPGGVLTVTAIGAGLLTAIVWPLGIVVASSGQGMARLGLDGATVYTFDGVAQLALALSGFPRAVLLAATAAALLPTSTVPRWIGWTGLGLAALALISTATFVAESFYPLAALGHLLFALWLVALCVAFLRRQAAGASRIVPPQAFGAVPVAS
jgi:hypothetical protein